MVRYNGIILLEYLQIAGGACGQNLGLIMQQNQDEVYTQSGSARLKIT